MTSFEDKISLMIPAYLRGELSDIDRLKVESFAAKNPAIVADIEFQKNLKLALKPPANDYEPGALGWARLSKAMETAGISDIQPPKQPKFWKYAAAILAVATIGQAGILGSIALNDTQNEQYTTVSEAPLDVHTVKVGFYSDVTENQLTKTLQSVKATIVAGPSSLGLYDVQFESEADCMDATKIFKVTQNVVDSISSCK